MKHPQCPHFNFALVIINGELTAVGGESTILQCTNDLFTLRKGQWVVEYPPMYTARYNSAIVSTSDGEYIFVIGGAHYSGWIATVELFQVSNRIWYKIPGLPQPLTEPSATICADQLHVVGGSGNGYSCSLSTLLSSGRPAITSQTISHLISWTPLPPLPVTDPTAATLSGQLVIVGGARTESATILLFRWLSQLISDISFTSFYQLLDGQWVKIGSITDSRWSFPVVSRSSDKMMIVGGWKNGFITDSVDECIVV